MPLRIAVIGVGHLGRHHARILSSLQGAELVAVVDTNRPRAEEIAAAQRDRKSTRLNSSHRCISYAVFCLKKKNNTTPNQNRNTTRTTYNISKLPSNVPHRSS